jgi:GH25 family lysozyme M1 (1,4-beta-N-acetylmuramidase)
VIDLSNNNSKGHDFHVAFHQGKQRRLYLKRCQGVGFIDKTYPDLRKRALAAGFEVGAYDFLEPLKATPTEAADFLLRLAPHPLKPGRDLRHALDAESGTPSPRVGLWVMQTANLVADQIGTRPLIYGSPSYLEACAFPQAPGPLWLAKYSRNDGKEHPAGKLPHPWKHMAAYQYTSKAHVPGIAGLCDLSEVFVGHEIDFQHTHPTHQPSGHSHGL